MKTSLVTMLALFLSFFLVACDQNITPAPISSTSDSDVQGDVLSDTTPAVKAAVVSGVFQNRVYFPPLLVPTTDTFTEGDTTTTEVDTSSSDVGEEVDLGPPLEEVSPPPDVESPKGKVIPPVKAALCQKMAELMTTLEGDEGYPPLWHHPGCTGITEDIIKIPVPVTVDFLPGIAEQGTEETTNICNVKTWYENHPCFKEYREQFLPALAKVSTSNGPWKPNQAYQKSAEPHTPQELYDTLTQLLKWKEATAMLANQTSKVWLSTFPDRSEEGVYQVHITDLLFGNRNGILIAPPGKIKAVAFLIHGHEPVLGWDGLRRNWIEDFGILEYLNDGIAIFMMPSRPYLGTAYPSTQSSHEPKLAYDMWGAGEMPLATLMLMERSIELEALKHLSWKQDGKTRTTAGVPVVYIAHSGGSPIAIMLAMLANDTPILVITDYKFSGGANSMWTQERYKGVDPPHCETIPGAEGPIHDAMVACTLLTVPVVYASNAEHYYHIWYDPKSDQFDPFINKFEQAARRQIILTTLGFINSPVIPPPGG